MWLDQSSAPTRLQRLRAQHEAWQKVRWGRTPGMVPILIWLVRLVPGLPGDGRAALDHVSPASISRSGHQTQGGRTLVVLEQPLQQKLCRINRSGHAATGQPLCDLLPLVDRCEPKGQRKQVCMQRSMLCSCSVTIETAHRIEERLLEDLLRRTLLLRELRGLLLLTQGLGQPAHLFQSAQMEGVDNRIDAGKDVAVAFLFWPIDNISMSDLPRRAHHQSIWTGSLVQELGLEPLIVCGQPGLVARLHPVGVGDEDHLRGPLGRPGRKLHETIEGGSRYTWIGVSGVVA